MAYAYDAAGRLAGKTSAGDAGEVWAYRYDADDRLTRTERRAG